MGYFRLSLRDTETSQHDLRHCLFFFAASAIFCSNKSQGRAMDALPSVTSVSSCNFSVFCLELAFLLTLAGAVPEKGLFKHFMQSVKQSVALLIPTPEGVFLARYSDRGLCSLSFPSPANSVDPPADPSVVAPQVSRWHAITSKAIGDALTGKPARELPPFDLSCGTEFQRSVWLALSGIACGQTLSYGQVAEAIGKPKALRAVGGACGANPIPVLIPCHRVLAAGQKIGGFSSDPRWKRTLLAREGVHPR
jgi:methylated-DNA-[protein]-cysteine S-methyltransferase